MSEIRSVDIPGANRYWLFPSILLGLFLGAGTWWSVLWTALLLASWRPFGKLIRQRLGDFPILAPSPPNLSRTIILASGLCLFFELLLIRYQASAVPIFGYYKNVSMLACFLGLGIGYATSGERNTLVLVPIYATVQVILLGLVRWLLPPLADPSRQMISLGMPTMETAGDFIYVYSFLGLMFYLTVNNCRPLGEWAGRLMKETDPLKAYGLNLVGSLLGIGIFTILSFYLTPPGCWFAIAFSCIIYGLKEHRQHLIWAVVFSTAVICHEFCDLDSVLLSRVKIHSPYQVVKADFARRDPSLTALITVNHDYYQTIFDFRDSSPVSTDRSRTAKTYYSKPYELVGADLERALIVGAGTGNDVAAAVRAGVKNIDAVEIDPVIARWGQMFHPEGPYQNPAVSLHVMDTRKFVRTTKNKFDIIVYGLLDSHTSSGMTNLRLDSFVYTTEALRQARALLKSDGIMVLTFTVVNSNHGSKIYKMLTNAFDGNPPRAVPIGYDGGLMYLAGPGLDKLKLEGEITTQLAAMSATGEPSTDDWPFFYLPDRSIPTGYIVMLVWLAFVTLVLLRESSSEGAKSWDWEFFSLGAGFMLIETRCITQLGLYFGNSWLLVPLVVSGILILGYFGNLFVAKSKSPPPAGLLYGLLAMTLIGEGFFRLSSKAPLAGPSLGPWLQLLVLLLPLLFAGIIFSIQLRRKTDISSALSSNLLGAMLGGCLEYTAMLTGFHALTYLGMGLYSCAFFFSRRGSAGGEQGEEQLGGQESPAEGESYDGNSRE